MAKGLIFALGPAFTRKSGADEAAAVRELAAASGHLRTAREDIVPFGSKVRLENITIVKMQKALLSEGFLERSISPFTLLRERPGYGVGLVRMLLRLSRNP